MDESGLGVEHDTGDGIAELTRRIDSMTTEEKTQLRDQLKNAQSQLETIMQEQSSKAASKEAVDSRRQKYEAFKQRVYGMLSISLRANFKPFAASVLYLPGLMLGFCLFSFLLDALMGDASSGNFFESEQFQSLVGSSLSHQNGNPVIGAIMGLLALGVGLFPFFRVAFYLRDKRREDDAQYDVVVRITYKSVLWDIIVLFSPIIYIGVVYSIFGNWGLGIGVFYLIAVLAKNALLILAIVFARIKLAVQNSMSK